MDKYTEIEQLKKKINKIKQRLIFLSRDNEEMVRSSAIEAMSLFYDGDIDNAILNGLKDKSEIVRVSSLDSIILPQNTEKVFRQIANLLKDKSPLVKSYAIDALAYNNAKQYKKKIKKLLKKNKLNDEVKISAYYALVKFGDKKYLKKLLKFLTHRNYQIRCATANLLYFLADKTNRSLVIKELKRALKKEKTKAAKSCFKDTIKEIKQL